MKMENIAEFSIVQLDMTSVEDAKSVDAYVLSHPASTPFHRPAWLTGVTAATSNRCYVLAAISPSGRLQGILPLHHVKSRLFGQAFVSSAFAVDGGILTNDSRVVAKLADAARSLAMTAGDLSIELRGGSAPDVWEERCGEHVGFVRPIAVDDDAELLAVPRKHRAELRKALANPNLRVETGRTSQLIRDHYAVYAQSVHNLGTPVFPSKLFREILHRFDTDADILVVYEGDRPVSAVLSLYHGGTVMPYWGGGIHDARRLRSNELMYYRLMGHARSLGMERFDFGRSKVGGGQASWKKSFGFEPRPLVYHQWSPNGTKRDIDPRSDKYQRRIELWKKLPLPIANLIGPFLSRGLG